MPTSADAYAIRILAEVPGVKPEDVKISVEDNRLTLRGTKKQVAEELTVTLPKVEMAKPRRIQVEVARA